MLTTKVNWIESQPIRNTYKFNGSALFGNEKDDSFKSSIGQIYQTFGGEELSTSVEEKAAMQLYLVTKNHSFSDGNKRIALRSFCGSSTTMTSSIVPLDRNVWQTIRWWH